MRCQQDAGRLSGGDNRRRCGAALSAGVAAQVYQVRGERGSANDFATSLGSHRSSLNDADVIRPSTAGVQGKPVALSITWMEPSASVFICQKRNGR